MSITVNHQEYCRKLLVDVKVQSILNNYEFSGRHNIIFPICEGSLIPQFFHHNLASSNRIIKYLNGEYCILRAFYFQLFKLMFEIEIEDKDYLNSFKEFVFDPNLFKDSNDPTKRKTFKSSGNNSKISKISSDSEQRNMTSNEQFEQEFRIHQKCILQFIEKVTVNEEQYESFEEFLKLYPQVDDSIINYNEFDTQLDSVQSILEYLAEIFQISLVVFQNCFKFEQSDVFLYVDEKQEEMWIYIAFNQIIDLDISQESRQNDKSSIEEQKQKLQYHIPKDQTAKSCDQKSIVMNSHMQNCSDNRENYQNNQNESLRNRITSQILSSRYNCQHGQIKKGLNKSVSFQRDIDQEENKAIFNTNQNKKNQNNKNSNQISLQRQHYKQDETITEVYEQMKFINLKNSILTSKSIEGSFQVIGKMQKDINKIPNDSLIQQQTIRQSQTETIINMFGDMLRSNIKTNESLFTSSQLPFQTYQKIQQNINKSKTSRLFQQDQYYNQMNNMTKKNFCGHLLVDAVPIEKQEQKVKTVSEIIENGVQIQTNLEIENNDMNKKQFTGYLIDSFQLRDQSHKYQNVYIQSNNGIREKGNSYHNQQKSDEGSNNPVINSNNIKSESSEKQKQKRSYLYSKDDYGHQEESQNHMNKLNSFNIEKDIQQASKRAVNQQQETNKEVSKHYVKEQKNKQTKINQNYQQDFFYRPIGSSKQITEQLFNYESKLGTIVEMAASKQTVKQSSIKSSFSKQSANFTTKYTVPVEKQSKLKQSQQLSRRLFQSNNRMKKYQGKVKDFLNEDSINENNGTFYRQFTNSKILKLLKEPYRTKVQILKHRFKGEHRIQSTIL